MARKPHAPGQPLLPFRPDTDETPVPEGLLTPQPEGAARGPEATPVLGEPGQRPGPGHEPGDGAGLKRLEATLPSVSSSGEAGRPAPDGLTSFLRAPTPPA